MQVLSIGADQHIEQIRNRLDQDLKGLQREGIAVRVSEFARGNLAFLRCSWEPDLPDHRSRMPIVRRVVAEALTYVITHHWEKALIRRLVRESYRHFGQEEMDTVCTFVSQFIDGRTLEGSHPNACSERRARILGRLLEYLERNDEVVLDGFVRFRLRDYLEELEDAVDRAVDEYLMEREYREFIRLLRYFVEMQESRVEEVHVLVASNGVYRLVDRENQPLQEDQLDASAVQQLEGDLAYEDLLVSSLIALAPRLVTVHTCDSAQKLPSLDTLRSIFAERLLMCDGCPLCTSGQTEERGTARQPQV